MANYISENDIEAACCGVLMDELHYDEHLNLWQLPTMEYGLRRTDAADLVRLGTLRPVCGS
ncbi:hypothetical protein [Salmonirosea aquatica]|uniref:Uncharacterized protein n=1 Tax=Salmonirosea aquatica TaxID=2654236 RepID=A0A7C9FQK0_9BACT|nr:hypothetical protein [Cytophagaceae bacterium SJW1-29]